MGIVDKRLERLEEQLRGSYTDPVDDFGRRLHRRLLDSFTLIELNVMREVNDLHRQHPELSPAEVYTIMTDTQRLWTNYYFKRVREVLTEMLQQEPGMTEEARREARRLHGVAVGSYEFYKRLASNRSEREGQEVR